MCRESPRAPISAALSFSTSIFSREYRIQCRTVVAREEGSVQATVVEVVNLGYLRPHHVEETGLAPFIEALNGPQEVVNRLEADDSIGI